MSKNITATDLDFTYDDEMSIRKYLNDAYDTRAQLAPCLASARLKEAGIKLKPAFAFVAMLCYRSMQRDMPALRRCHFRVYVTGNDAYEVYFTALAELDQRLSGIKLVTITVLADGVLVRNDNRFAKVDVNADIDVVLDSFLNVIEDHMLACVTTAQQKAAVSLLHDFRVYQTMHIEALARMRAKAKAKKPATTKKTTAPAKTKTDKTAKATTTKKGK